MGVKIIAEIGVNHNGSRDLAGKLLQAAKECGVDAVKIQVFKPEDMVLVSADKARYQKETAPEFKTQFDMLKQYELAYEDILFIRDLCRKLDLELIATPFDFASLEMIKKIGLEAIKVSSGDLTNIPLLQRINDTGQKVIISTGMAGLAEVEEAVSVFNDKSKVTLLHCTSNYPAKKENVNLRAMISLRHAFRLPVGYSDHTEGIEIAVAAAALGAEIIEKHFTLDRNLPGPDHKASLEPEEFAAMVKSIRHVEAALGDGIKRCSDDEWEVRKAARKSVVAAKEIKAGELFTENNLGLKRPGLGLHPRYYNLLIGRKASVDIAKDEFIKLSMVEGEVV
ncbi:N-acetylneuraminate synthase [Thermincola potens]|uniref:N-acetylneuraminate synthase n=1 Tax=Thermincola potens (strain JR) TaxID=635013 RepID=D5XCT6_THEPJ|nr:N-acetylneuraminate synthase [Thermincola potens]ADG83612.1 N-acetylneuraminate synthase [Thermincola potens JR]